MSETMDWQPVAVALSEQLAEAETLIAQLAGRDDWNPAHVAALTRKYVQAQWSRIDSLVPTTTPAYSVDDDGWLYSE